MNWVTKQSRTVEAEASINMSLIVAILVVIMLAGVRLGIAAQNSDANSVQNVKNIDKLSVVSLQLRLETKDYEGNIIPCGSATGFVVERGSKYYLITNWHVVSGQHPNTRVPIGAAPFRMDIMHNAKKLGKRTLMAEELFDTQGKHRWIEHPWVDPPSVKYPNGRRIDVIALPLQNLGPDVKLYPLDLSLAGEDIAMRPAMPVSIIGFPVGLTQPSGFPIWKIGHMASEHDLDHDGLPTFLVDTTVRPGMSGSPVVSRVYGAVPGSGDLLRFMSPGGATRFLGILSGGFTQPEVGIVWRPHVIKEILDTVK